MKHWLRHRPLTLALAAAFALASQGAAALGLGQIEVRSRAGQPLLAEIPVVSSDPSELEALQARLASPDTFARIGLNPPQGVVADLRFDVALDNAGRPVIRVTTAEPVNEPLLTFLVEVDWGQGRLVREYSALVDTPRTVSAPEQPPVQAPVATPPPVIQRPVEEPAPVAATTPETPAATEPRNEVAGEYGPVKRGESVSKIAAQLGLDQRASLDQAMAALLRANPEAFIGGDINQLRQGAVLRVPTDDEVTALNPVEAGRLVRARAEATRSPVAARAEAVAPRTQPVPQRPADAGSKAPRQAPARLAIVPPAPGKATRAGTQSGIQAAGEGTMLRQELQQTKETLAARDAELAELRSRVADLEKMQTDQQKLVALKDSELAAAQQRLAQAQKAAATPTQAQPAKSAAPASDSTPWLLGGVGLLAALLGGWWLSRRNARPGFRAPEHPVSPRAASFAESHDEHAEAMRNALADAFPSRAPAAEVHDFRAAVAEDEISPVIDPAVSRASAARAYTATHEAPPVQAADSGEFVPVARTLVDPPPEPAPASPRFDFDRRETLTRAPEPAPHFELPRASDPAPSPDAVDVHAYADDADAAARSSASGVFDAPIEAVAPVNERIELAQAYLDLGDRDSARQLLGEVVVNGDHASRQQAVRMLRELE